MLGRRPRVPDLRLTLLLARRYDLAAFFVAVDAAHLASFFRANALLGGDAALYTSAARAWLSGGDPWQVSNFGIRFAAPPPTLIPYVPFAFLAPSFAMAFWVTADILAILFVLRRLKLAWWWGLFPPIWEGALPGNPEPVVLACLVATSPLAGAAAAIFKVYAIAPLLSERRWRPILITGAAIIASAPLLPWSEFVHDLPIISTALANQTAGLSAFSIPWLLPAGLLGLGGLGVRRAGWLIVPVLWPHTQLHYATTALPAMTRLLAVGFSLPVPGAPAVAVAAQALLERYHAHLSP